MMTEPKQPENSPAPEDAAEASPAHAPNGVPPAANDADAKGTPNSDRHKTETAASPEKHQP